MSIASQVSALATRVGQEIHAVRAEMADLDGGPGGVFDVTAYGAVGDGATDDTAAIQAAISASSPGSTVWFPGGTYKVTSCIQLAGGRSYIGSGGRAQLTTIHAATGVQGAVMAPVGWYNNQDSVTSIRVEGILLDCNSLAGLHGLVVYNFWSTFADVQVRYCNGGNSFHVTHLCRNGTTSSTSSHSENKFVGLRAYGGTGGSTCFRVYIASGDNDANQDGHLLDSYFTGNATNGNYGHAILVDRAGGWTVENNHTYDIGLDAIRCLFAYGTKVLGNYIEDEGLANAAGGYYNGVVVQQLDGRSSIVANNTVSITQPTGANPVTGARWTGIYVGTQGSGETRAHVVILGNSVVYASSATPTTNRSWAYDLSRSGTASLFVTWAANQVDATVPFQTVRNVSSSGVTITEPGTPDLSGLVTTTTNQTINGQKTIPSGAGNSWIFNQPVQVAEGTVASHAARRDDPRFSDARTPTAHSAALVTSGTLDAERLPLVLGYPASASGTTGASVTPNAATGSVFSYSTTSATFAIGVPTNPSDRQVLRIAVKRSTNAATMVNLNASIRLTTGLASRAFPLASGEVLLCALEYSTLAGAWALTAATTVPAA